jgi:hypothetical protein
MGLRSTPGNTLRRPPPEMGRSTAERSEGGRVGVSLALISPAKTPTRLPFLASLEMTIDLPLSGGGIHAARGR